MIKALRKCFYACQLPGSCPLTIISFVSVVKRCAALVNFRPVAIIKGSLINPDKITTCSPNSLRGSTSSAWWSLGAQRNYRGQQQLLQSHLARFSKYWRLFYSNKLYSNSNMATRSELQLNDVVLITDLASNSGRSSPHPAIGRLVDFIDPEHKSQAVVKYHSGKVDRPVSRLVRVVKADEQISKKGK